VWGDHGHTLTKLDKSAKRAFGGDPHPVFDVVTPLLAAGSMSGRRLHAHRPGRRRRPLRGPDRGDLLIQGRGRQAFAVVREATVALLGTERFQVLAASLAPRARAAQLGRRLGGRAVPARCRTEAGP
jgi:hypothetical protein